MKGLLCFSVQKDDLDGEIDLKSCVKVSEFDVGKNYGFQIQVSFTLFHTMCVCVCECFSSLYSSLLFLSASTTPALSFLNTLLSWLTSPSVSPPPLSFSQYFLSPFSFYHLHLTPILSHLCVSLTCFSLLFSRHGRLCSRCLPWQQGSGGTG